MIWILSGVAAMLLTALLLAILAYRGLMKRSRILTEQMEDCLAGRRETLPVSTRDDGFAALENAASQLQERWVLEQEKVRRAQREEADFLADISHQFKTPLSAMKLFCEMDQAPHHAMELELIERMEGLIYALLRLEKLKSGAYEMDFAPRQLAPILQEVCREMQLLFPAVRLSVTGEGELRCDEKFLWEAVGNVVKNACQHAKERVTVTVEAHDQVVFITVADDGGGVPEGQLGQLFRRFSPLAAQEGQSSGLGLAITRAIVEKHHGTVDAANTGLGLTITLCFPVLEGRLAIS